jgi:hypothetical protein
LTNRAILAFTSCDVPLSCCTTTPHSGLSKPCAAQFPIILSLSKDSLRMMVNTNKPNTKPTPFGLSLSKPWLDLLRHFDKLSPFDRLRMHGHFDKLSANGVCFVF